MEPEVDHSELTARVIQVIRETGGDRFPEIAADNSLAALGMDSLDMAMMAMTVEREFRIVIETEELPAIRTVQDIVNAIEKKLTLPA